MIDHWMLKIFSSVAKESSQLTANFTNKLETMVFTRQFTEKQALSNSIENFAVNSTGTNSIVTFALNYNDLPQHGCSCAVYSFGRTLNNDNADEE